MKISLNNTIDSDRVFPWLFSNEGNTADIFFCGHTGPSMNPTLTARDLLEIKPYQHEGPRVGDIILFQSPGPEHYVIHRIISITANGIQTRGDNNCNIDQELLTQDDIFGRVIAAHRGSSRRKIVNGYIGRIAGRICHLRRLLLHHAVKFLGPVYRSLCTGGRLQRLIPVRLSPRLVTFNSGSNTSHRLLLGRMAIGTYDRDLDQWQIRRPYRILVDESSLPAPR